MVGHGNPQASASRNYLCRGGIKQIAKKYTPVFGQTGRVGRAKCRGGALWNHVPGRGTLGISPPFFGMASLGGKSGMLSGFVASLLGEQPMTTRAASRRARCRFFMTRFSRETTPVAVHSAI